jgi:uncharacterized protein (TIGR02246 family)
MRPAACILAFCAILAALPGCRLMVREARRDSAVERHQDAEVDAALARYRDLVVQVDAPRLADMFDADGEISYGDQKASVGHDAILAFFNSFAGYKVVAYELRATGTSAQGGSATQSGTYSQTAQSPSGETIKTEGKFEARWARQADGRWLLKRMHTSPLP